MLSDPGKRAAYDAELSGAHGDGDGLGAHGFDDWGFDDLAGFSGFSDQGGLFGPFGGGGGATVTTTTTYFTDGRKVTKHTHTGGGGTGTGTPGGQGCAPRPRRQRRSRHRAKGGAW